MRQSASWNCMSYALSGTAIARRYDRSRYVTVSRRRLKVRTSLAPPWTGRDRDGRADTVKQAAQALQQGMVLYRNPSYPAPGRDPEQYALYPGEYEDIVRTVLNAVGWDSLVREKDYWVKEAEQFKVALNDEGKDRWGW